MRESTIVPEKRWKRKEAPRAPLWARAAVILIEVIIWLVTLGMVKRVEAVEALFHYSPHWKKRDRAEASIKGAFRTGMGAARRLARPLLRIETEFSAESSSCDSSGILTPLTATVYKETLQRRQQVNARVRSCLRGVPVDDLQAPLLVNACTWNVDQQAPPVYEDTFLSWLIGQELTDKVKHYQEHKQAVLASGGSLRKPHYRSGSSTMRSRKASANASSSDDSSSFHHTTAEDFRLADQKRAPAILEKEWHEIEAEFPDLFLISLQEVEMTGTALVKESTQRSWEWADAIIETLAAASDRTIEYKKVQVVQLVGLVLIVLIQAKHVHYVSHVHLSLTRTGALSVLGNKGSVAMRVTIYGKRFLFISAHFVAHKHNEKRRTSNYQAALKDIRFDMPVWSDDESEVLQTFLNAKEVLSNSIEHPSVQGNSAWDRLFSFGHSAFRQSLTTAAETRVLDEHDYVFFLGDLNSRLHALPSALIKESVKHGEYDSLLCHDELRQLMVSGEAFDGFQEQWISFPPTYKYDRGTDVFDTSRKHCDPAWCDRVLFRVLENDAVTEALQEEVSTETRESSARLEPPLHDLQLSALMQRDLVTSGVWMSLEELESKHLAPNAAALTRAPSTDSSSLTSSEDLACEPSLSHDARNTAGALRSDFDTTDKLHQCPSASFRCRAPTHAVWEQKRCAPTFCAARHSRDALESSSGKVLAIPPRFPMITNHIHPLEYISVPSLRQSDHRPVRARFEVKVISIATELISKIVGEVQHVID
ncbi:hypothetical protein, conserved [Leishmania tarentolae]|uniref:Inositol polyphosphate-related phosphatase domain-containing protein n=1 Tax=Leishmania tarentolae TaxID=5689 RepID=A0A640KS55_LEITA|nr:hypothetical protein, conserved [Leishmania tarentolae]